MAFTPYIPLAEIADYGIADAADYQIAAASRMVHNFLGRPEGLLYASDANGNPAFMMNLAPTRSYALSGDIAAGQLVAATVQNGSFGNTAVGDVVILDRNTNAAEACVISEASGNVLTLQNVQFAHSNNATIDFGLTLLEESPLRRGVPVVRAKRFPVANILCGFSRYSFPKHPLQITDHTPGMSAMLLTQQVGTGLANEWAPLDMSGWDINSNTGAITLYPYALAGADVLVRLRYVAGWMTETLPGDIKQAVANVVRSIIDTPFPSTMKLVKAGDSTMERFGPGHIDADTKALLQPYRTMTLG
jgi:hypothetical protein